MKTWKIFAFSLLAALAGSAAPASARVSVVAANQDLAWFTGMIGGKDVSVDYIASSNEDPHHVDPRPSQVAKLSRADAVVRIGMDLDLWFDSLIRASGNSKIVAGGRGYIDASNGVRKLEVPSGKLDPSKGDIHVYGNPHYLYGPQDVPAVVHNIVEGLKRIDSRDAATFEGNAHAFLGRLNQEVPKWKARLAGDHGKPVVTYHKSLVYFLTDFGLHEVGNVEPRPGIEPTPGHIASLAGEMKKGGVKAILMEGYRSRRWPDLLARESGAKVVVLPSGIGAEKGVNDYFSLMSAWVERVASAL